MLPVDHFPNDSNGVSSDGDGVRIFASARLVDIADAVARAPFPLLGAACRHDMAYGDADTTLADCLAPATSCVRVGDGVRCALNGTAVCAAREPDAEFHSVIGGGPCWRTTQSAMAVALVALDADLELRTAEGSRWMSAGAVFAARDAGERVEHGSSEPLVSARVPPISAGGLQRFGRATQDDTGSATVVLAAVRRDDGDVRLVLGGISPGPYRVYTSVEEEAMAGGLDEDTIAGLADRALLDAEPDPRCAPRVEAAAELLREAIREIATS